MSLIQGLNHRDRFFNIDDLHKKHSFKGKDDDRMNDRLKENLKELAEEMKGEKHHHLKKQEIEASKITHKRSAHLGRGDEDHEASMKRAFDRSDRVEISARQVVKAGMKVAGRIIRAVAHHFLSKGQGPDEARPDVEAQEGAKASKVEAKLTKRLAHLEGRQDKLTAKIAKQETDIAKCEEKAQGICSNLDRYGALIEKKGDHLKAGTLEKLTSKMNRWQSAVDDQFEKIDHLKEKLAANQEKLGRLADKIEKIGQRLEKITGIKRPGKVDPVVDGGTTDGVADVGRQVIFTPPSQSFSNGDVGALPGGRIAALAQARKVINLSDNEFSLNRIDNEMGKTSKAVRMAMMAGAMKAAAGAACGKGILGSEEGFVSRMSKQNIGVVRDEEDLIDFDEPIDEEEEPVEEEKGIKESLNDPSQGKILKMKVSEEQLATVKINKLDAEQTVKQAELEEAYGEASQSLYDSYVDEKRVSAETAKYEEAIAKLDIAYEQGIAKAEEKRADDLARFSEEYDLQAANIEDKLAAKPDDKKALEALAKLNQTGAGDAAKAEKDFSNAVNKETADYEKKSAEALKHFEDEMAKIDKKVLDNKDYQGAQVALDETLASDIAALKETYAVKKEEALASLESVRTAPAVEELSEDAELRAIEKEIVADLSDLKQNLQGAFDTVREIHASNASLMTLEREQDIAKDVDWKALFESHAKQALLNSHNINISAAVAFLQ